MPKKSHYDEVTTTLGLMPCDEFAELVGSHPSTIRCAIRTKALRGMRIGSRVFVYKTELDSEWVKHIPIRRSAMNHSLAGQGVAGPVQHCLSQIWTTLQAIQALLEQRTANI